MAKRWFSEKRWLLLLGDALVIALVTLFGFERHPGTTQTISRKLTTFIPFLTAWILVAPHLGVFDIQVMSKGRQLWRPFWAMILAAPLAAFMRGIWLRSPIQTVFVIVVGGISALSLLVWRSMYWVIALRERAVHG